MPIMDGYQATRCIRNNPNLIGLPVIAMTANAMKQDIDAVLKAGMNDHIAKPVDPKIMAETMMKWITPLDQDKKI